MTLNTIKQKTINTKWCQVSSTWLQWRQRALLTAPIFWWGAHREPQAGWSPCGSLLPCWQRAGAEPLDGAHVPPLPRRAVLQLLLDAADLVKPCTERAKKAEVLSWFSQLGLIARFLTSWKMFSFKSCLKTTFVLSSEHWLVDTRHRAVSGSTLARLRHQGWRCCAALATTAGWVWYQRQFA